MKISLYHYKGVVRSVYDGDTCTVDIDLGLGTWIHGEKLRLYRITAPELKGSEKEAGLRAHDFLRSQLVEKEVYIQSIKDRKGKDGRYLAEVWFKGESGEWVNVNDVLVQQGYAVYQDY